MNAAACCAISAIVFGVSPPEREMPALLNKIYLLLTASASARELGFLVLPSNSTKGLIQEPLRRFKYAIFEGDRKDDHMLPNAVSTPKR